MASVLYHPGFRFSPTDEELVCHYLRQMATPSPLPSPQQVIGELDLYRHEPWDLPDLSLLKSRDTQWFFFIHRERRHQNGSRTNRATAGGYWKATGKDRKVTHRCITAGMKKTLVYYIGRAPNGERTDWVMHEYRLDEDYEKSKSLQSCHVLCKVFKKAGPGPRNGEQYGAPVIFNDENDDIDFAELPCMSRSDFSNGECDESAPSLVIPKLECSGTENAPENCIIDNQSITITPPFLLPKLESLTEAEYCNKQAINEVEYPNRRAINWQPINEAEHPNQQDINEPEYPNQQDINEPEYPNLQAINWQAINKAEHPNQQAITEVEYPNPQAINESGKSQNNLQYDHYQIPDMPGVASVVYDYWDDSSVLQQMLLEASQNVPLDDDNNNNDEEWMGFLEFTSCSDSPLLGNSLPPLYCHNESTMERAEEETGILIRQRFGKSKSGVEDALPTGTRIRMQMPISPSRRAVSHSSLAQEVVGDLNHFKGIQTFSSSSCLPSTSTVQILASDGSLDFRENNSQSKGKNQRNDSTIDDTHMSYIVHNGTNHRLVDAQNFSTTGFVTPSIQTKNPGEFIRHHADSHADKDAIDKNGKFKEISKTGKGGREYFDTYFENADNDGMKKMIKGGGEGAANCTVNRQEHLPEKTLVCQQNMPISVQMCNYTDTDTQKSCIMGSAWTLLFCVGSQVKEFLLTLSTPVFSYFWPTYSVFL